MAVSVITAQGSTELNDAAVASFAARMQGPVLLGGDPGYDDARTIWNAMIDRRPALIARCTNVADVQTAVGFAREHDLLLSIKGGGHNVAGKAVCNGGLMIDLSLMKGIQVDPATRTVRAEGGVTWGEFDAATVAHGLAMTGGFVASTGIAGLTLGGGFGFLMRKFGMTCDNLRSAQIVTADGQVLTASADEHPELFWALRGGGGNFGVVTSFEFGLHPIPPAMLAGFIVHPAARARDAWNLHRELTANAPEELATYYALGSAPDGTPIVAFIVCYNGPVAEGEKVLAPYRSFGSPLSDGVQPMPYTAVQGFGDPLHPWGRRNYWKSSFLPELSDGAIDALIEHHATMPKPFTAVAIEHLGGAISRVPVDATAFSERNHAYNVIVDGQWIDPAEDAESVGWVRGCWEALQPFASESVYVNYLDDGEEARVTAAYGAKNFARLASVKREYDPGNLFRVNFNVAPAGA